MSKLSDSGLEDQLDLLPAVGGMDSQLESIKHSVRPQALQKGNTD